VAAAQLVKRVGRFVDIIEQDVRPIIANVGRIARDASRVSDEAFAELSRHLNEGEIVEVTCVVGLFAYLNRFNQALCVEPTRPGEGLDS